MFRLELGDVSLVKAELETLGRLSEELKQPAHIWLVVASSTTLVLFEGRFEEAEKLLGEALALGQRAQSSDAVLSWRIHRFTLGMERGELDGLDELLERSVYEYPARPMFRCMLARLSIELGREAEARAIFQELAADEFAPLPRTNEWLFSLGYLAEIAAVLGDDARAAVMHELLLPYAARNASTADYVSIGSVSRYLGLLAATMSRFDDAERHFEDALAMNARMGARPWLARTEHDYARMLVARGGPGDRERAGELLASALRAARELGLVALEPKASALLGELGALEMSRDA
jgi:tetratricopeptide (TPR) repeat protein